MSRNYALIEQVWQYIQDHPRQHYQRAWFHQTKCGTVACFAGWTALLSGYQQSDDTADYVTVTGDEIHYDVADVARRLLGLTWPEGHNLFRGSNTRPMLALMVKDLLNGAELQDPKFYRKLRKEQIAAERKAM